MAEEQLITTEGSSGTSGYVSASAEIAPPTLGQLLPTEEELRTEIAEAMAASDFGKVAALAAKLQHLGNPTGEGGGGAEGVNDEEREGVAGNSYGEKIYLEDDFVEIVRSEHSLVLEAIRSVATTTGEGAMMRDVRITDYGNGLEKALGARYAGMKLTLASKRTFDTSDGYGIVSPLNMDGSAPVAGECGVLVPQRLRIGGAKAGKKWSPEGSIDLASAIVAVGLLRIERRMSKSGFYYHAYLDKEKPFEVTLGATSAIFTRQPRAQVLPAEETIGLFPVIEKGDLGGRRVSLRPTHVSPDSSARLAGQLLTKASMLEKVMGAFRPLMGHSVLLDGTVASSAGERTLEPDYGGEASVVQTSLFHLMDVDFRVGLRLLICQQAITGEPLLDPVGVGATPNEEVAAWYERASRISPSEGAGGVRVRFADSPLDIGSAKTMGPSMATEIGKSVAASVSQSKSPPLPDMGGGHAPNFSRAMMPRQVDSHGEKEQAKFGDISTVQRTSAPRGMTRSEADKLDITGRALGKSLAFSYPASGDSSESDDEIKVVSAGIGEDMTARRLAALERKIAILTSGGGGGKTVEQTLSTLLRIHHMRFKKEWVRNNELGGEEPPEVSGIGATTTLSEIVVEHLTARASKKPFSRLRRSARKITDGWPGLDEKLDLPFRAAEVCVCFNGFSMGKEGSSLFPSCCFATSSEMEAKQLRVGDLASMCNAGLSVAEMTELGITKPGKGKVSSVSDVAAVFSVCGNALLRMSVILPGDEEILKVSQSMIAFGRRLKEAGPAPGTKTLESLKGYLRSYFNANHSILLEADVDQAMIYAGVCNLDHVSFTHRTYRLMDFGKVEVGAWAQRVEAAGVLANALRTASSPPRQEEEGRKKKKKSGVRCHNAAKLPQKCRIILPATVNKVEGVDHLVCGLSNYANPEKPDRKHGACSATCPRLKEDPLAHAVVDPELLKKSLGASKWTETERQCLAARRGVPVTDIRP